MSARDELIERMAEHERNTQALLATLRAVVGVLRRSDMSDADAALVLEALAGRASLD